MKGLHFVWFSFDYNCLKNVRRYFCKQFSPTSEQAYSTRYKGNWDPGPKSDQAHITQPYVVGSHIGSLPLILNNGVYYPVISSLGKRCMLLSDNYLSYSQVSNWF